MARSVFATARTLKARFFGSHQTNGAHFSAERETENSIVSVKNYRYGPGVTVLITLAVDEIPGAGSSPSGEGPSPPSLAHPTRTRGGTLVSTPANLPSPASAEWV